MHKSSMDEMRKFITLMSEKFVAEMAINILDVGSQSVNTMENYHDLICNPNWCYTGYDITPGHNVNIFGGSYSWPIMSATYNIAISGQCLEHVGRPWLWIKEFVRVLKPGGWGCVIAPHTFKYHCEGGEDCWRVWPKGMQNLIESAQSTTRIITYKNSTDTIGVFQKVER